MRIACLFALLPILMSVDASAEIDPRFGVAGSVRLGFQPQYVGVNADRDRAFAACGVGSGPLMVVGLASDDRRIVTAWLTEDGELDVRYSADGKESFTLHQGESLIFNPVGTCLPDGDVLLAYEVAPNTQPSSDAEGNIHLRRIDAATGLPDPGFGNAGLRVLDLDMHASTPIGTQETVRSINPGLNGEWLLGGTYSTDPSGPSADAQAAWVARIGPNGEVRRVALLRQPEPLLRLAVAVVPGSDGSLWLAGRSHAVGSPASLEVIRLDPDSLLPLAPSRLRGSFEGMFPERGVRLPDGSLAVVGRTVSSAAMSMIVTVSPTQDRSLVLPLPPAAFYAIEHQVAALPGGDLLVAGRLLDAGNRGYATLFTRLGLEGNTLRRIPSFGNDGSLLLQASGDAACNDAFPEQNFIRFTYWHNQPTAVGAINTHCGADDPDVDYHVQRLKQPLLRHGFD